MSRRALIISNPGEKGGKHYCHGVNRDVDLYTEFLTSGIGGRWYSSEIMTLPRPSRSDVRVAMHDVKRADYSLVIFCGHGGMYSLRGPTMLELRAGEELDSDELREGTSKRTIILDCCREVARPAVLAKRAIALDEAVAAIRINLGYCRASYDSTIEKCSSGLVVMFGCSPDERAGDDAIRGGYYSSSLIEAATSWATSLRIDTRGDSRTWSVVSAHDAAEGAAGRLSGGTQHPTIQKPRSGDYFPFAVVA